MINLDHEIIIMFVKDNISWKVLSITISNTFVRPCHWGVHSEVMTSSAHNKAMPSSAYYYQPRSLNNKNVRQRQHFLRGSKSYRLVALSWGLPSSARSARINTINNSIMKTPVVSRVGVTRGKNKHQEELRQKDSRERRKMLCHSAGGERSIHEAMPSKR